MKILIIPSVSMRSYSRDMWLLTRDGFYTQMEAWCSKLKLLDEDIDTYALLPSKADIFEIDRKLDYTPIKDYDYSHRVSDQRSNFKWRGLLKYAEPPDIVFVGHIEYVEVLRALWPSARIVVLACHGAIWSTEYEMENSGNIRNADAVLYNFSKARFSDGFKLSRLFSKFAPILNFVDVDHIAPERRETFSSVLFMSRLSDPSRYDIPAAIKVLKKIAKTRRVYYTDPSESAFHIEGATRLCQASKKDFFKILDETGTVILPYSNELTYSTSYFEALARGCRAIAPVNYGKLRALNSSLSFETIDEVPAKLKLHEEGVKAKDILQFYVTKDHMQSLIDLAMNLDFEKYVSQYGFDRN